MNNSIHQLKFIHITKCAGTSIEDIGKNNGMSWGRFDTEYINAFGHWHACFSNDSDKISALKNKYKWFMVVRDPYERLISEFYCIYGGYNTGSLDTVDLKTFNSFIKNKIINRSTTGDHYTEQYKYLDINTNIHIIHFENIEVGFNQLMESYNSSIRLNEKRNAARCIKQFTKESFTPELIMLINYVYHYDFVCFGYKKMMENP